MQKNTSMDKYKQMVKDGIIDEKEYIAIKKYINGEKYEVSTFIDEHTITVGYNILSLGDFEFELPLFFRIQENIMYGCKNWKDYFINLNRIEVLQTILEN